MTSEQKALLDRAADSLRASELLLREGLNDFAASRAYYTMFYIAQVFLLEAGAAHSRHSAVISAFGEKFAKTGSVPTRFHRYLIDAEAARNIGDYQVTRHVPQERAAELIGQAREFVEFAARHFA